ncbi:MAG TPA: hypothetical protein VJC00_00555 [Candidatus Nanoarchaeia archaeon]|nr:hypothetical protein [Candidatus Nanoarchaeia archaeon]
MEKLQKLDIVKELAGNKTVLLLMPSLEYNDVIVKIAEELSGKSVCYVTLNKTYDSLKELFNKKKVDMSNIVFVDAISKTIKKTPSQTDSCYFVSSPGALTELSLVISKFLKHNFEYVIFDSVTNLMIYEKRDSVIKFVSYIINKVEASQSRAVFYSLNIKEHESTINELSMFSSKVIDLTD